MRKSDVQLKEKISYGLGNFSAALLLTTANTYIIYYYTDVVGITAAVVGTILLVAKLLDGIFDLSIGTLLDHQQLSGEKSRPWIKKMAIPFGLALILMYSVPNGDMTVKIIYAFITYIIAMFIFSAISVPYNTMISLVSSSTQERGELSNYRNLFGSFAGWFLTVITLPLVAFFGSGRHGWFLVAVIYGIVATLCYFVTYKNTKERVSAINSPGDRYSLAIKIKAVISNRYWWITLFVMILTFITAGLGGINIYFAKYVMGDTNFVGVLGTANYATMIIGGICLIPLSAKFKKRNIVISGIIVNAIGCVLMIFLPENVVIITIGTMIKGMGSAAVFGLIYAMLGDTVDYGEWRTGNRAEGITFSAGSFSEKIGSGIGTVVLGSILTMGGYIGGNAAQSENAIGAISFIFIWLPLIIDILSVVLLLFYNLDDIYETIRMDLKKHGKTL